ncbi:MAG: hypothetical protein AUI10_07520 [Actinobacteria bacterium 13_2_20CM_2_72_6]|nr:MAG: hypothetical protein AUI10_07520 [Actinobacteria bacterium 13_2_20CM_2_72_6]
MASVVVAGGGIAGLAAAVALSDRGHVVRLLDREPDAPPLPPRYLAGVWYRPSVPQADQPHSFTSLGMNLLRERAPDVYEALLSAGAVELDLGSAPPAARAQLPYDPELRVLACRRKVFEAVLRQAVLARPRVTLQSGTAVRGLLFDGGSPRVVGVRTAGGERVAADLVVDATGWRSLSARWLAERHPSGSTGPADAGRTRVAAYTRFYRLRTDVPPAPLNRGNAAGGLWSHFSAILHPGDNGTFTISLGVLTDDDAMKGLRREPAFDAAAASVGILAPWLAPGASEPISEVHAHSCPPTQLREPDLLGGEPVQGLVPVGDAACVTNPLYGRGVSLGLAHAFRLAGVLDTIPRVGPEQARLAARVTASLMTPWYRQGQRDDEELLGIWRATVHGAPPPVPPAGRLPFSAVAMAAATDPVVFRRAVRVQMCLDEPDTLYTDDEIRARVQMARTVERPHLPGPDRAELVGLVAAAGGSA